MLYFLSALRIRLILVVLAALLPSLALIFYTGLEHRRLSAAAARQEVMDFARHVSMDQERVVAGARHLLFALAQMPPVRERDRAACSKIFDQLLKQYTCFGIFALAGSDGEFLASSPPFPEPVNIADRPYFKRIIETREFVAGEYIVGRVSGKAVIPLGYPVLDADGRICAVIGVSLDLAWLDQLLSKVPVPEGATLTVIDRYGTILARVPDPDKFAGDSLPEAELVRTGLSRKSGVLELPGLDGVQRLYGFMPLDSASDVGFIAVGVPVETIYAKARRDMLRNLAMLATVAALALLAAWLFGNLFVMRGMNVLVGAAQRLAQGDLSARTGFTGKDEGEIGQLGRVLDETAEALEKRDQERKRYEEELMRQSQELARSNAELDQFAFVASHDLKEPLRVAARYLELLARRYKGKLDSNADDFIAYALDGIHRMQGMIDGLLALSRVTTKARELEPVDCNMVLDRAISNLQIAIEESKAVITHDPLPSVRADAVQLVQLFQNLIGNALKFRRDERHRVHIGAKLRERNFIIWVRDNGIGIAPENMERIFLLFERMHARSAYPGTGIGLAISRRIVERHGGQIWAESTPGEGSTFYFTVPLGEDCQASPHGQGR